MTKLKSGVLCFLVGPSVPQFNRNKIVQLTALVTNHPCGYPVWSCIAMQPLMSSRFRVMKPTGSLGHAAPKSLRPIDPDGTVTQDEVNELYTPNEKVIA